MYCDWLDKPKVYPTSCGKVSYLVHETPTDATLFFNFLAPFRHESTWGIGPTPLTFS